MNGCTRFAAPAALALLLSGCASGLASVGNDATSAAVCAGTAADRADHAGALVALADAIEGGLAGGRVVAAADEAIVSGDMLIRRLDAGCGDAP